MGKIKGRGRKYVQDQQGLDTETYTYRQTGNQHSYWKKSFAKGKLQVFGGGCVKRLSKKNLHSHSRASTHSKTGE